MRLPRDISGTELARLLGRNGYESSRQTGSHLRLISAARGTPHHITVPLHANIRIGTLARIVTEVALYLEIDREQLATELFHR